MHRGEKMHWMGNRRRELNDVLPSPHRFAPVLARNTHDSDDLFLRAVASGQRAARDRKHLPSAMAATLRRLADRGIDHFRRVASVS
jgi:hypothetical protein